MLAYRYPLLLLLGSFIGLSTAGYTLQDDYNTANFFSMFNFYTGDDPTAGYVDFVSQSSASSAGLINTNNNQIYMGVDSSNIASGRGRKSVRLTSKAVYNKGLIVLDLAHMPGSICGVWPAFWTFGPNWPGQGEIDIIEGVNSQSHNSMTLHTGPGCTINGGGARRMRRRDVSTNAAAGLFSGQLGTTNCDANAAGQPTNAGCQINLPNSNSYGNGLNSAGGGVYATEWTSTAIKIWFFSRGSIPSDLSSGRPNPSGWGLPAASFGNSGCNIDQHFQNHNIIFDTTFCGSWAGTAWSSDPTCSGKAGTCQAYVQNNPGAFKDAFWSINSLKVYQSDGTFSVASAAPEAISSRVSAGGSQTSPATVPVPAVSSVSAPAPAQPSASSKTRGDSTGRHTRTWQARGVTPTRNPEPVEEFVAPTHALDAEHAVNTTDVAADANAATTITFEKPMDKNPSELGEPLNSTDDTVPAPQNAQLRLDLSDEPDLALPSERELDHIRRHLQVHKAGRKRDF